jgi:hypothetical protein
MMFKRKQRQDAAIQSKEALRCSFCNKGQDAVGKLIAGPSVYICDECVQVCNDIIADDKRFSARAQAKQGPQQGQRPISDGAAYVHGPVVAVTAPAVRCALCRMPTPSQDGLLIPNRGVLCPGCLDEIEATIAERRQLDS